MEVGMRNVEFGIIDFLIPNSEFRKGRELKIGHQEYVPNNAR
jgi:hypothetical protein